jgi:hypothetical protein
MKHTEKYLQAKWVTENPNGHDERDVVDAKRYCNAYLDGYNQALRIHDVMVRSEQLPCSHCGRPLKEHSKDSKLCPDRMKNFEQGN